MADKCPCIRRPPRVPSESKKSETEQGGEGTRLLPSWVWDSRRVPWCCRPWALGPGGAVGSPLTPRGWKQPSPTYSLWPTPRDFCCIFSQPPHKRGWCDRGGGGGGLQRAVLTDPLSHLPRGTQVCASPPATSFVQEIRKVTSKWMEGGLHVPFCTTLQKIGRSSKCVPVSCLI